MIFFSKAIMKGGRAKPCGHHGGKCVPGRGMASANNIENRGLHGVQE